MNLQVKSKFASYSSVQHNELRVERRLPVLETLRGTTEIAFTFNACVKHAQNLPVLYRCTDVEHGASITSLCEWQGHKLCLSTLVVGWHNTLHLLITAPVGPYITAVTDNAQPHTSLLHPQLMHTLNYGEKDHTQVEQSTIGGHVKQSKYTSWQSVWWVWITRYQLKQLCQINSLKHYGHVCVYH